MNHLHMQSSSFFVVSSGHPEVIHVLASIVFALFEECGKVSLHGSLKEGWCIAQAKVHDCGDVCALLGFYGRFVLVLILNANVTIAPSNVEFGEEGFAMQCFHCLSDAGNRVVVLLGDCIHSSVVHDDALLIAILLPNGEDR